MISSPRQLALITGASSGIGKATALAFAKAGIETALVGRSIAKLEAVAQEIEQLGGHSSVHSLDLMNVDQVKDALSAIAVEVGAVDMLINNAGMGYTADLVDTPLKDWQAVLNLNLTSVFQCIQALLPGMRARQQGTIVNIISIAGRQAFPGWGAYCASKFGLMGLSKALAAEERAHGVRVIALCPGAVDTPLWESDTVQMEFDRTAMLSPESVAQTILHIVRLPQQAVVEELVLMPQGGAL
jgi:NADP-dependent 3-hydroxy acid dehydrogenase YdfG